MNNDKKIVIVGHYAVNQNINDGQTVKTRNLFNQLKKKYDEGNLYLVDTYKWKNKPFRLLYSCIKAIKKYDNIIILPAHNGIKIFVPLFVFLNKIYHKNLIYVVIGGWLYDVLKCRSGLIKNIRKFNCILVETRGLKDKLIDLGIDNVDVMLNFKDIKVLSKKEISFLYKDNYSLCTFSRVMKEKGISDAIHAVVMINEKYKKEIFKLDVYGPIDDNYKEEFDDLLDKYGKIVCYKGVVDSLQSVTILKQYDLLLFPTRFKTEGLPGTIIDAFSSGVPSIYSSWDYCDEFYDDNYNGIKFEIGNVDSLVKVLDNFYNRKYDIKKMKENCLESAKKYDSSSAIKVLIKYLR